MDVFWCESTFDIIVDNLDKVVEETLSADGKELNLKGYCIGPNGMSIITRDERVTKVRRLNLGGNRIGDDGVKMLQGFLK